VGGEGDDVTTPAPEWIELAGSRLPVRLTRTRIVVQMAVGFRQRLGEWREYPNVEGYFDLAEPRSEYGAAMSAEFVSNYLPCKEFDRDRAVLGLANPATWPPCSDGVRAALEARAQVGREIIAARERREATKRMFTAQQEAIQAAERAVLRAARSGNDADLVDAAAALRRACA
jgi:hypothetical protein